MLNERIMMYLPTLVIVLVSLTIHEYAHGWVAYKCGDDTAKRMGRLTLNPLAHISFFGTIVLPLIVKFGWAKPVPVNFAVLSKRDVFKVAVAGPAANILLAVVLVLAFHVFGLETSPAISNFVLMGIFFNLILAVFNLLPIPPLDGSRMVCACLKSPVAIRAFMNFGRYGMIVLVGFIVLGGFSLIFPVFATLYALLRLPLPAQ